MSGLGLFASCREVRTCAQASSGKSELDQGDLLPRDDHQLVSSCAYIHLTLGVKKRESGPAPAAAAAYQKPFVCVASRARCNHASKIVMRTLHKGLQLLQLNLH